MKSDCRLNLVENVYLRFYVITKNKMNYLKMLEDVRAELKKVKAKKSRTNIKEQNALYKELCYRIWLLEEQEKRLLNLIQQNEWQKK